MGDKSGRPPWKVHFGENGLRYEVLTTRARAILAAAFAEQRYTLHPWLGYEWEPVLEAVNRVFSLMLQAKCAAEGTVAPGLPPLYVFGEYKGLKDGTAGGLTFKKVFPNDHWRTQKTDSFDKRAVPRFTLTTPIMDLRSDIQVEDSPYLEIRLYATGEKLPSEVWELLKSELSAQLSMPVLPLNVYSRKDLHRTVGLTVPERLWDLRVRFTDFLRRFLACYRHDINGYTGLMTDPFTVFFVQSRTHTSKEDSGHVRSGLFGHSYAIDDGQRQYLQEQWTNDHTLPTDAIHNEHLPFPDGLCARVYLTARSSESAHVGKIIEGYRAIANDGELKRLEETLLHEHALMEIPVYDDLSMLSSSTPDGPRLILCVAIPNLSTKQKADAGKPSKSDIEYLSCITPPSFSNYGLAEEQVAREMAHKMTRRYLSLGTASDLRGVIGVSTVILNVKREAERIASKSTPVLILGQSGTGKTRLAKSIHFASRRAQRQFESITSAPDELFYGELFGWEKGAHSTADRSKDGLALIANGGTVFIDDVDRLTKRVQAHLLKFLDDGKFRPLGSREEKTVDVRIIAATNQPLKALVASGAFREDLYYRLCANVITIPPLRDRKEDILLWAEKFLEEISLESGRRVSLTPAAIEVLMELDWPGNLRMLRATLDKASDLAGGGEIRPEHILTESDDEESNVHGKSTLFARVKEALLSLPGNTTDQKLEVARLLLSSELDGSGQ